MLFLAEIRNIENGKNHAYFVMEMLFLDFFQSEAAPTKFKMI